MRHAEHPHAIVTFFEEDTLMKKREKEEGRGGGGEVPVWSLFNYFGDMLQHRCHRTSHSFSVCLPVFYFGAFVLPQLKKKTRHLVILYVILSKTLTWSHACKCLGSGKLSQSSNFLASKKLVPSNTPKPRSVNVSNLITVLFEKERMRGGASECVVVRYIHTLDDCVPARVRWL